MIVYKDLISGDEMMTDAFPQNPVVCDGETIEGMFEVRKCVGDSACWSPSCSDISYDMNRCVLEIAWHGYRLFALC